MTTSLDTLSKADLNNLLATPLTASALKKIAKADLVAMADQNIDSNDAATLLNQDFAGHTHATLSCELHHDLEASLLRVVVFATNDATGDTVVHDVIEAADADALWQVVAQQHPSLNHVRFAGVNVPCDSLTLREATEAAFPAPDMPCDLPNGVPPAIDPALKALAQQVRAHAVASYEKGGWDVIVECWSDNQIAEAIVGAKTLAGAIRKLSSVVSIFREQQNEARIERGDAALKAKKPARRPPQTITVAPRGDLKPFRPGTIQAQVAELLHSGATIADLRRICIRRDGKVWADSAIKGLFSTDMRAHGYGIRTELWSGFQLWQNSSFDDNTSFTPTMMALENGHPDDNRDHDAILADAIANHGFDPEELHQVFFLVDPKA